MFRKPFLTNTNNTLTLFRLSNAPDFGKPVLAIWNHKLSSQPVNLNLKPASFDSFLLNAYARKLNISTNTKVF